MKEINWNIIKNTYPLGNIILGRVLLHRPFGIFIDINDNDILGIVGIIDFLEEDNTSRPYPEIGSEVCCKIIGYTEDTRNQIWLSVNPDVLSDKRKPFGFV